MKPAVFEYCAPRRLDDVVELLNEAPDDTSLLAGGQSLVPMLNMRLARPRLLIDLNRVADLGEITLLADGGLRLGAMVRQRAPRERTPKSVDVHRYYRRPLATSRTSRFAPAER